VTLNVNFDSDNVFERASSVNFNSVNVFERGTSVRYGNFDCVNGSCVLTELSLERLTF
jgi:hypothetical protein